jgi:hypothetical protein
MPYISQDRRDALFNDSSTSYDDSIKSPGELNYMITLYLKEDIEKHGLSYQSINDIVGALEGAKLEFYRRVVGPYEDTKKELNGDVY